MTAGRNLNIGELAERLGTTPRTLRFYEEEGLLAPERSPGGTRRYGPET
ncbi:MAG: MerR family transcriptional regulator, partial [Thiohalospira sp.]